MSAPPHVVRLEVDGPRVRGDAPAGLLSPAERAELRSALDLIRPTLARTCSPPLPPRETWPDSWREAWAERVAIVSEASPPPVDPEAVADADLRAMIARGELAAAAEGDPLDLPAGF